jgi:hypothetical protein
MQMAYPPYSLDLTPSDYNLFGTLKEALRGYRFTSDEEMKEAHCNELLTCLHSCPKAILFATNLT